MQALIDRAAEEGVSNVVIGMPHRGRLNILGNVVRKPLRQIFTEFTGKAPELEGEDQYLGARSLFVYCPCSFSSLHVLAPLTPRASACALVVCVASPQAALRSVWTPPPGSSAPTNQAAHARAMM